MIRLEDFCVLQTLRVHSVSVEPKRVHAHYTVVRPDQTEATTELIYSYESPVFDPESAADRNLASLMLAQAALNYGLFCREIVLEGHFDTTDRGFLKSMLENTSREILTNKLLTDNEFIKPSHKLLEVGKRKKYTCAELIIRPGVAPRGSYPSTFPVPDYSKYAILSSGGKDSLLTYGLVSEFGDPHPVFINEAGRHWFTAVNAYRYFKANEPNTAKPWCNSDRVFNWMLRQLPFIREDYASIRADAYPIRLWTVATFLFGVLPIALKRGLGNILVGDEYDTTVRGRTRGISHYSGLYDQSKFFDNALTRYYRRKGWHLWQYSLLRSLSELLIMKVLTQRYPDLQVFQISCHAAHEEDGHMKPCGRCEKCRRIIGMMVALGADPIRCGYTVAQVSEGLRQLGSRPVKQIGSDAAHLYFLLSEAGVLPDNQYTKKLARPHPEIMKLRFDKERSRVEDIPLPVRKPLFNILRLFADGCVHRTHGRWEPFCLHDDLLEQTKYRPYVS
ncbi:MAG: hypothetical protein P8Z38_05445 [Robiginitalea sp.]